ncbi:Lipoate-protein ligase LplJ [Jeotgalicoccus saudimassiliensis]|uniref:lipoate--protein ligase n=1 Tax=Jeotgalicoccus saudimassiliensis TaxID=1461582 RepID=A0A078MEP4_9STAP|nr:lipoate--protein ligase [Jeotgalicoccus saudimassiliensis]CEA03922.1 Lipoate-protein ligase LplJ [Jeotgalicoccus saudimassiliensis]
MYLIEPYRNGEYITDGAYALAMQVYVQDNIFLDEGIIFPYYCKPKVEIGRFQNAVSEVNQDYLEDNDILLVRRDTGGGAILVDDGAVNVCFLVPEDTGVYGDYKKMYAPVIKALNNLGITNVEQSGRNDLVIDGKKVSGGAMTMSNGRVYGGFSLLLDINVEAMVAVLNPNRKKIESKGIKSVQSRVTTLREHLAPGYKDVTTEEFKDLIIQQLLSIDDVKDAKRYELTDEDWKQIDKLVEEKYKNWDWNYGKSPRYSYNRDGRLSAGTVDISLEIEGGRIDKCSIFGDFFGQGNINEVEDALKGTRVVKEDLLDALKPLDLDHYFGKLEASELTDLILS